MSQNWHNHCNSMDSINLKLKVMILAKVFLFAVIVIVSSAIVLSVIDTITQLNQQS